LFVAYDPLEVIALPDGGSGHIPEIVDADGGKGLEGTHYFGQPMPDRRLVARLGGGEYAGLGRAIPDLRIGCVLSGAKHQNAMHMVGHDNKGIQDYVRVMTG